MELLKQLYLVSSPSREETDMFNFLDKWLNENGIEHSIHEWGITCTKGIAESYPCVVAHMDEVHKRHEKKQIFVTDNGIIFGYDTAKGEQCGIGADDKNGIWVALKMLQRLDAVKVAFFVGEEIGCVGSSECDMTFFDDCRFVIQCDRRNGGDFITDVGIELCSDEFVKACQIEQFGYHVEGGLMTDVMTLKERGMKVSSVNLSCGYYNPHTDKEYTKFSELCKCLEFVYWICTNLTESYPHEAELRYGYMRGWSDWDGYDWEEWKGLYGYGNFGEHHPAAASDSLYDETYAYNFIYDELCLYGDPSDGPTFEDFLDWWRYETNGKGIGKKKLKKVYNEVVHDIMAA